MHPIHSIQSREILDSRGLPTVEVDVVLSSGIIGRASVPSGASTGQFEALEKRDGDSKRFHGKGVQKVIHTINTELSKAIVGMDVTQQRKIDEFLIELDGTPNKSHLGANATLGISLACAKAGAIASSNPLYEYLGGKQANTLPMPFVNVINGGAHANNTLDVQEFMIVPVGATTFRDAIHMSSTVFTTLKTYLKNKGLSTAVGDEGGVAPCFHNTEDALETLMAVIEQAGLKPGQDIAIALDVAATELYEKDRYYIDGESKTSYEMVEFYEYLCNQYPIISIEDGLSEEDWEGWQYFNKSVHCQIVGDDLLTTNKSRLQRAIDEQACNAILIKPNQIGTLSETLDTIHLAQHHRMGVIISHRSGETEDTFIADLAVAVNAGQIKTGSMCRGERIAKYNQLMRIEDEVGGTLFNPFKT